MATHHSPGPWVIERRARSCRILSGPAAAGDAEVCCVFDTLGTERAQANADLIAAAPELLAAMRDQRCAQCGEGFSAPRRRDGTVCETCARVVAAIAIAEGR